ncbi:MAG: efflux RND transporter permease subunit [Candidatus Schekmanbacteria bacterium]|nr:efflux RND transporter permease subunit [Candidatus Schekmanbacteria bacterium]
MTLVEFSLRRRVTVSMCAVTVVLFGIVGFTRLPLSLLPTISYPSLTVETKFPGAAPAEVETLVSRPIEEGLGVIAGVQRLTSISRPGQSHVVLEMDWGRDMAFAAMDVRQKLDLVQLPREVEKPVVLRFDPANDPLLRMYLTGGQDLYQLRYVAEELLQKDLESTAGVAAIRVSGGYEEEIEVRVDEGKLPLVGLTIGDVSDKLLRENVNQAGGSLYEREARYLVRARNEFENLNDILSTVLVSREDRTVTVGDVAVVERGHKRRDVITRLGGKEAVELAFFKEGDANIVQVARGLKQRLERVKKELPAGIELTQGADQSVFIEASIQEVLASAISGGLLAMLVLMFFLKDLRSTLIISLSIPISIISTFFLMYRTGTTLNIMSLGGLALGVGMLVDNAIVVLEAIFNRRQQGGSALEAARAGASEVGRAVIASTLTTVAVFLPVVFLEGIAAQLFRDMALTVSYSLLASLAVSLTLIPMMAALSSVGQGAGEAVPAAPAGGLAAPAGRFRRAGRFAARTVPSYGIRGVRAILRLIARVLGVLSWPFAWLFDACLGGVMTAYPRLLHQAVRSPIVTVFLAVAIFVAALVTTPLLGVDLIPSFSQGEFSFKITLPEGTPLESTDAFIADVQQVLAGVGHVASYASIAGTAEGAVGQRGSQGENAVVLQVRMATEATREQEAEVIAAIRQRLERTEQAKYNFERPSYFSFRTPIEVEIYDDGLDKLHEIAEQMAGRLTALAGLVDVESSAELGNPEVQVRFNRDQLARLGLDLGAVANTVRTKIQGQVATRFTEGDREIDIRVVSVERGQASAANIQDLIVGNRDGVPIFLKSVASVTVAAGPTEIRRIGQKRAAVVSANLLHRDMGSAATDVRAAIAALALPASAAAMLGGQHEEMSRSLRSLLMAMALAIFLVYLVMASQFESFLQPFIIILSLPLGAVGVVLALLVTGQTVNVVAMIGIVMLAGIVVNNAIVLIDAINQLREAGLSRIEAIIEAGSRRLRPILMTSLTTILGLLPMAAGVGDGAELRAPLAITVIGGLTVSTLLTLVVIPAIYVLVDRRRDHSAAVVPAWDASTAVTSAPLALVSDPSSEVAR